MNNLKSPAYPYRSNALDGGHTDPGFTKLERASLMIAQGMATVRDQHNQMYYDPSTIAKDSVLIAKAVIEEANK